MDSSSVQNYFCHICKVAIVPSTQNYECPRCHQGFIEQLPGTNPTSGRNNDNGDELSMVFENGSNNMGNIFGVMVRGEPDTSHGNATERSTFSGRRDNSNLRNDGRRFRSDAFEHILADFFNMQNDSLVDMNNPILLVSNPGDYVWGREGLDSIVTQLFNQMDSSGPPPLAKEKIKDLPVVDITEKHIVENTQCSVCWDSFKINDKVRQLPCEHIYHDPCIIPWLQLHGTCPICRKLLSDDTDRMNSFTPGERLEAIWRAANRSNANGGNNSSASSTNTTYDARSSNPSTSSAPDAFLDFD